MIILSISDTVLPYIYSPLIREKFQKVGCVIGCGDIPYYYQEYIVSLLNVPLFYVHGNHDSKIEYREHGAFTSPVGGTNLHQRVVRYNGLLMAGVEGCIRFNSRHYQYSQLEMWWSVFKLVPGLLWNRLFYGRFLDVFVSHAPPWGINDGPDHPHIGIKAYRWLLKTFKPKLHLHGHIHIYQSEKTLETQFGATRVLNTYGYKVTDVGV